MTLHSITPADLEPAEQYETHRREALRAMNAHKRVRRMQLADDVSLLWEDRTTIRHQIQEMVRLEGDDEAVEAVFRAYDDLVPKKAYLTASLFLEVQDPAQIKPTLRRYARIEDHLHLVIGPVRVRPVVLGDHGDEEAATAVTYLGFFVPDDAWPHLDEAVLEVDHPMLTGRFPLPDAVVQAPV